MRGRMGLAAGIATLAVGTTGGVALAGGSDKGLFGVLSGANELTEDGERGAGDRNGRGTATAVIDGRRLCFGLTVRNINRPVAAHIHRGRRNENGPVVIPLRQPLNGDPGSASGCTRVNRRLARQIMRNPQRFYWNVHTRDFPAGAVRGQLFAPRVAARRGY